MLDSTTEWPTSHHPIKLYVFDQIPRAVTAREEKRLLKFQERLLQEKKASEKEENMVRNLKQPPPVLPDFMMYTNIEQDRKIFVGL